jgi:aromatic-L-amino-acid/L-tryptophan decarboxylase
VDDHLRRRTRRPCRPGRHNALARQLASLIEASADLEPLAPVVLSVVCFRYAPARLRGQNERLDALNKGLMEEVQASGEAFVSGTTLRNRFALRACVLHYDTVEDDLAALVQLVNKTGARLI